MSPSPHVLDQKLRTTAGTAQARQLFGQTFFNLMNLVQFNEHLFEDDHLFSLDHLFEEHGWRIFIQGSAGGYLFKGR